MARNTRFRPAREPLRHEPQLKLDEHRVNGPVAFLNPTQARFTPLIAKPNVQDPDATTFNETGDTPPGLAQPIDLVSRHSPNIQYKWTSRNNRKGRHTLIIPPSTPLNTPSPTTSPRTILHSLWRMCTYYPYWDISFLVAYTFTWGSILWVINAFFVFLPFLQPPTTFPNEQLTGGGITAFIGATIFELGSILLMLEAVNENRAGCFGWAVEQLYDAEFSNNGPPPSSSQHSAVTTQVTPAESACSHHHQNRRNLIGRPNAVEDAKGELVDPTPEGAKSWVWWPSTRELRTHYVHDLGFLACAFQTLGATVFWISGFTALPGILNHLSRGLTDGIYWTPQVVGGSGFVISGALFMLETQQRWWKPALGTLGWHVGVWNLIGGVGFTLSPAFGYAPASWAQYQAACSTFWGSWAFLIGSVLQWYESLEKHPVEVEKR